jgi:putative transposase
MRPSRELFRQADQTYFASFQTARRQCFFRNERWSTLFLHTLKHYLPQLGLHDFVIMPDHIHLLLSPPAALEKSIQLIKGGYSFRAKREFQWKSDIWQAGFTDHRIRDLEDWDTHTEYIRKNALSSQSEGKAICAKDSSLALHPFPQWLKPPSSLGSNGGAEAPPLQSLPLDKAEAPPLPSLPPDNAEAQPLQGRNPRLEDFYRQHSPPSPEGRTDIHYAKDAADLFRKLGI